MPGGGWSGIIYYQGQRCGRSMPVEDAGGAPEGERMDLAGVDTMVRQLGEGPVPLVMLHGVLSDGLSWFPVAESLARRGRRVVLPDMPLHGETVAGPGFRPGPEGMVTWLEALLNALGADSADLCGLSMGGAVASHFAIARPGRVRHLVLVDAANIVPMDMGYRRFIDDMREGLEAALGSDISTSMQCWTKEFGFEGAQAAAAELCADPIVMGVLEYLEARGIPFGQVISGLQLLEPLGRDRLSRIVSPTLAIWGTEDPFFPCEEAVGELRAVRGCRTEVMEGAGHNPIAERPSEFIDLVDGFLG